MPQILVTIDTEVGELGKDVPSAFEVFIEGKVHNKEVGYRFIIEMLDNYEVKGEFFVDIYPYKQIGEPKFASLCENIVKRGHYVQLHTHPSMIFDKNRIFMHQYSLEEQIKILSIGKEKIKEWIGVYPMAHRAGGYGINGDIFKALEKVEINYDSSYFYGNKNCKFQSNIKNRPFKIGSVIEIPITVFKEVVNYKLFRIDISHGEHFDKLDIRYGITIDEIKKVISKSAEDDIIVLFLHSFNFLTLPYNFRKRRYSKISINEKMIREFENLLRWISLQKNCSFTTINTLRVDFSQNDPYIEIARNGDIVERMYYNFTDRILRIRKT